MEKIIKYSSVDAVYLYTLLIDHLRRKRTTSHERVRKPRWYHCRVTSRHAFTDKQVYCTCPPPATATAGQDAPIPTGSCNPGERHVAKPPPPLPTVLALGTPSHNRAMAQVSAKHCTRASSTPIGNVRWRRARELESTLIKSTIRAQIRCQCTEQYFP